MLQYSISVANPIYGNLSVCAANPKHDCQHFCKKQSTSHHSLISFWPLRVRTLSALLGCITLGRSPTIPAHNGSPTGIPGGGMSNCPTTYENTRIWGTEITGGGGGGILTYSSSDVSTSVSTRASSLISPQPLPYPWTSLIVSSCLDRADDAHL